MEVDVHEAKTHLSKLLEQVELGDEITLMRANMPVAKLVGADRPRCRLELGWARGEIRMSEDFDDPLPPEILDAFYK